MYHPGPCVILNLLGSLVTYSCPSTTPPVSTPVLPVTCRSSTVPGVFPVTWPYSCPSRVPGGPTPVVPPTSLWVPYSRWGAPRPPIRVLRLCVESRSAVRGRDTETRNKLPTTKKLPQTEGLPALSPLRGEIIFSLRRPSVYRK